MDLYIVAVAFAYWVITELIQERREIRALREKSRKRKRRLDSIPTEPIIDKQGQDAHNTGE